MTAEPSREPSHTASSSPMCLVCGVALSTPQQRYCTRACQQRAYRLRHQQPVRLGPQPLRAELRRQQNLLQHTVYECPACETRAVGDQRCADCNTFTRRIGLGGSCPECDAVILLTDLIKRETISPSTTPLGLDA
jgi:hypothetical protein